MLVNIIDVLRTNEKLVFSAGANPALGNAGAETASVLAPRTVPSGDELADPPPRPLVAPLLLPPLLLSPLPPPLLPPETVPLMSPTVGELAVASELSVPVTSEALAKDTPTKAKASSSAGT